LISTTIILILCALLYVANRAARRDSGARSAAGHRKDSATTPEPAGRSEEDCADYLPWSWIMFLFLFSDNE